MRNLWSSIDDMAHRIAMVMGKEPPEADETMPKWSSLQLYKMRHWLIDLRKHQYYVREAYEPMIPSCSSFVERPHIDWGSNSGYWRKVATSTTMAPPHIQTNNRLARKRKKNNLREKSYQRKAAPNGPMGNNA